MTARQWAVVIVAGIALAVVFGHFEIFRTYEHVALWLEGVALVVIFGSEYFERLERDKERKEENKQWLEEMKLSRNQLTAATQAAVAAKRSADIQATLHRPLLGLDPPILHSNINDELWSIALPIRNYGTLSASDVSMQWQFLINDEVRSSDKGPQSIQIFPRAVHTVSTEFKWNTSERLQLLQSGSLTFKISARINYGGDGATYLTFTCDAQYFRGHFVVENSKTEWNYTASIANLFEEQHE